MWKLILAFVLFAALALWVVSKGGNQLDMGARSTAEAHEGAPAASEAASMALPAPAASEAASAASN
jgi:hypothetical protein